MLTVIGFLIIAAFISLIVGAMGKCPWWVSVLFLCIVELLRILPLGASPVPVFVRHILKHAHNSR